VSIAKPNNAINPLVTGTRFASGGEHSGRDVVI
jgi:hypothetical protein